MFPSKGNTWDRNTTNTNTTTRLLSIRLWNNLIFKFSSMILGMLKSWSWNLDAGGGKYQKRRTKQARGTEWWQQHVNIVTYSVKAWMVITRIFATCSEHNTLKKGQRGRCVYVFINRGKRLIQPWNISEEIVRDRKVSPLLCYCRWLF